MVAEMSSTDAKDFENLPAYKFAQEFNGKDMSRNPLGSGPYIFKEWLIKKKIISW